jgi:DNA-binding transcriptional LysR family regulator
VSREPPFDLNLLAVFARVAEAQSFSRAARQLGRPRSSVSRQIAELEAALGVQLFNRTTRHVALSTAGAALHERVAPQLAALRTSLGSLPEREAVPSGTLRLAALPDMATTFLPDALTSFAQRYPAVDLDVRLSPLAVDLVAGGYDAALRVVTRRLPDSSLVARRLGMLESELFAAPAYLARRGAIRTPEDTATHDWVMYGDRLPPPFPRPARAPRVSGDDMLFIAQAIRAGLGLGILPTWLAAADVRTGALVRPLPRVVLRGAALYFVSVRARAVARKVIALRDHLIEYLAAHPLSRAR